MAGKRAAVGNEESKSGKRASETPSVTDSPLKKLRARMQARRADRVIHETVTLSTVDEFREFVLNREQNLVGVEVIVRAKLLWVSSHNFTGRQLLRLHLTDAEPEEALEELMEFRDVYERDDDGRRDVDEVLLTATIFGATLEAPNLPRSGDVLRIVNSRRRMVFDSKFCQLVARLTDISVE